MRAGIGLSLALGLVLCAATARAGGDTARQYFETGKKHRDDGECTKAIVDFEKSIALERSIGALYNLGFCHEQLGHHQDAFDAYRSAQKLASAKKDERLREISGALATLLEMPHVRLALPYPPPPGLKVTVDDQEVVPSSDSTETVVFTRDVRNHVVVVSAPGYEERRENVETRQLKAIELRLPVEKAVELPPRRVPGPWHWQRWLGIGVGVVGASAFVYGGVEGLVYLGDRSELDDRIAANPCTSRGGACPANATAEQVDESRKISAANNALIEEEGARRLQSIVPLVLGTLAMGTGVILFVTAPRTYVTAPASDASTPPWTARVRLVPNLGHREQGLAVVGTF